MPSFRLSNSLSGSQRYICFINATLQLLAAIPIIKNFFTKRKYQQSAERSYRICSEISRIFNMTGRVTSAGSLRQDVGSLPGNHFVKDGHMQDADHFLKVLTKALDAEIGCEDNRNTINHTSFCFIRSMEGRESYDHRFTNSEDGSCSICGYRLRKSEENFRVLHLLNRTLKAASVQELLNENLYQPSNKFQYKCRCGVTQDVEDWRSISKIPEVLLLNVEKFEAETKSGVTDEYLLLNGVQYQLTAVMDHIGRRRDGGHWITWSRCPEVRSGWI